MRAKHNNKFCLGFGLLSCPNRWGDFCNGASHKKQSREGSLGCKGSAKLDDQQQQWAGVHWVEKWDRDTKSLGSWHSPAPGDTMTLALRHWVDWTLRHWSGGWLDFWRDLSGSYFLEWKSNNQLFISSDITSLLRLSLSGTHYPPTWPRWALKVRKWALPQCIGCKRKLRPGKWKHSAPQR